MCYDECERSGNAETTPRKAAAKRLYFIGFLPGKWDKQRTMVYNVNQYICAFSRSRQHIFSGILFPECCMHES